MKIHPRMELVIKTEGAIGQSVFDIAEEADLTSVELMGILVRLLASCVKHQLRRERHPNDPDKGADEE